MWVKDLLMDLINTDYSCNKYQITILINILSLKPSQEDHYLLIKSPINSKKFQLDLIKSIQITKTTNNYSNQINKNNSNNFNNKYNNNNWLINKIITRQIK